MKRLSPFFLLALLAALNFSFSSCSEDEKEPVVTPASLTFASTTVDLAINEVSKVSFAGGTAPYSLSGGENTIATATLSGNAVSVTGKKAGSTTFVINDANKASIELHVKVYPEGMSVSSINSYLTIGENASVKIIGGTAPYTIEGSGSGVATASVSGNIVSITAQSPGTATFTVKDAAGTTAELSVKVNAQKISLSRTYMEMGINEVATIKIIDGVAPYTVSGNNEAIATGAVSGSSLTVTAKATGTTPFIVKDANGNEVELVVNVSTQAVSRIQLSQYSIDMEVINSSASLTISGGVAPYTLLGKGAGVVTATLADNTVTIQGLKGGETSFTVRDASNSEATFYVDVTNAILVDGFTSGSLQAKVEAEYSGKKFDCDVLIIKNPGKEPFATADVAYLKTTITTNYKLDLSGFSFENNIFASNLGGAKITELIFPASLEEINGSTLNNTAALAKVTFSANSNLKVIGNNAFTSCSGLKSINLPANMTSLGTGVFQGCSALQSINATNKIPEGITSLNATFSGCSALATVLLPSTLKTIEAAAFLNCTSLTSIVIPEGVTETVNAGTNSTAPFGGCNKLESVTLPNSLTKLAGYTFYNCSKLTNVTLPGNLMSIGAYTFYNCAALTSIVIPQNITSIEIATFYGCSGLLSVTFPAGLQQIMGGATTSNGAFFNCTKLTTVTLPEGFTGLGLGAFYNCSGLQTATLPSTTTSIGASAFANCTELVSVTVKATTPPALVNISAFPTTSGKFLSIYVPSGSLAAYEAAATWNNAAVTAKLKPIP